MAINTIVHFSKIKLCEQEVLNLLVELSHVKKAYFDVVQKNGTLSTTFHDLNVYLVEAKKMETVLKADHGTLKADYDLFLGELEGAICYIAENTSKAIEGRNEAALHAKKFAKAVKLFGFS